MVDIPNNVPVDVGPARLGVIHTHPGPPVRASIAVMPWGDDPSQEFDLELGGTFPIGLETWRLAHVHFASLDEFTVTVRRVDGDEPQDPPSSNGWVSAELRPYGSLDEAQLNAVESALGRQLPLAYRHWLANNNGAQPEGDTHIVGAPFTLMPERPLLGVHPGHPHFDLVTAQQRHRDPWLAPNWLVIGVPSGGLLVVQTEGYASDTVHLLPEDAFFGPMGPAGYAAREAKLIGLAEDIYYLLGRLQPLDRPDLPPATIVRREPTDPPR